MEEGRITFTGIPSLIIILLLKSGSTHLTGHLCEAAF